MALKKAAPKELDSTAPAEEVVVTQPVTEVVTEDQDPVPEVVVTEDPVVTEAEAEVVTDDQDPEVTEPQVDPVSLEEVTESRMVTVLNLRDTYFHQPSTGLRIEARAVKELKADGWLEGQIAANLLKLV